MIHKRRALGWLLLVCWFTWIQAGSGWLGARVLPPAWVPHFGLLLFLAVAARLDVRLMARRNERAGYAGLVLAAAASEIALTVQAPAPVLAGWIGLLGWQNLWRRGLDVERPLLRILVSGSGAAVLLLWRTLVLDLDLAASSGPIDADFLYADAGAWRGVLLTAALAPLVMPLSLALPGIGLYWRKR